MGLVAAEIEKLECKYCKIELMDQSTNNVGFVTCPDCQRTYLKLPQSSAVDRNISLSLSRKKILDLFVSPQQNEKALEELRVSLRAQEENLASLKAQKESIDLESSKARQELQTNLNKTQEELEEISILNQELSINLNETNFELKRIQDIISEKNQMIVKLKSDIQDISEKLSQREALYDILEKENGYKSVTLANVSNDSQQLKNLCNSYVEKITALEADLNIEKNRISDLNLSLSVIPELEVELEKAKATIYDIQKFVESNNNDIMHEMGIDQVDILNEEINALKADIKEYTSTIAELQNSLSSQNDVIRTKETEIYSLYQTQETKKVSLPVAPIEPPNLFSNFESDEISKLRDRVRRQEQIEQKLESTETELEISRDELAKAQKEIVGLNGLLEKAFYENQKNQTEVQPAPSQKLVSVARDIEKREDDLMEFSYEVNNKIDLFIKQFERFQNLAFDVAIIREDDNGRVVSPLFAKGTLLPIGDMELKKVVSYKTTLNKGLVYFQHDDQRNSVLNNLKLDFSSNSLFFLNEEEFAALVSSESEVEIREEYTLNSAGELSVSFYRNNGFKRFDAKIGKLITESVQGIAKINI